MQVALLGGAFNPIHFGHLFLAQQFSLAFPKAELLFVPSSLSAHKSNELLIAPQSRIEMTKIALQDPFCLPYRSQWHLDTCEIEQGGVSYTANTVRLMKKRYGADTEVFIVIGDDLVPGLGRWRDPDYLFQAAKFVVAGREQVAIPLPKKAIPLHNSLLEISSTAIRDALMGRTPNSFEKINSWLPKGVYQYIKEHHLYGT